MEASYRLSIKRAMAVMAFLRDAGGLPERRMHVLAHGDVRPLAEGQRNPEMNRRVNIKLVKSR